MSDELASVLRTLGVDERDVARAEADGTLVLLAIERLVVAPPQYDLAAVSERTGFSPEQVRGVWRSLGFPDPADGEPLFGDVDVENLRAVAELIDDGIVTEDLSLQMTRVVGSSMARIASAMVDAVTAGTQGVPTVPDATRRFADDAGGFLPRFPRILEHVWRRHLQAAARRRLAWVEDEDPAGLVVGFADLVGFTALAQQVTDEELAAVVDEFERLAYDVVVANGGRVVKTIGDEVMFLVEDPERAAQIALGLADASRETAGMSDVRVGLALGPVLLREGDAFGNTVNLASRITSIAYPGTVVVSDLLRGALEGSDGLSFRAMRPRFLKHLGRVQLHVLRREGEARSSVREAIEVRRRQMRESLRRRSATPGDQGGRG